MAIPTPLPPQSQVREATLSDVPSISALGKQVFSTTFGHSVTPEQLQKYLEEAYSHVAVAADIQDPNKDLFVSLDTADANTITGFALLTRGSQEPCVEHLNPRIELQRLYIGLEHHGKGYGKVLSQMCDDVARKEGFKFMWLGVWEENVKAQAVYTRLGYQRVGEHVFDVGGDLQTDHIMFKPL